MKPHDWGGGTKSLPSGAITQSGDGLYEWIDQGGWSAALTVTCSLSLSLSLSHLSRCTPSVSGSITAQLLRGSHMCASSCVKWRALCACGQYDELHNPRRVAVYVCVRACVRERGREVERGSTCIQTTSSISCSAPLAREEPRWSERHESVKQTNKQTNNHGDKQPTNRRRHRGPARGERCTHAHKRREINL